MGAPVTVPVGHTGSSSVVETVKATGVVVPPIGPIVYASDNTAVATIDSAGNWTAVAAGTANVSALDQGNGLTDTVAVTVTAAPPVADTLTLTLN